MLVDSIINAWRVIPVIPRNKVLENHSLIIDKGIIIDVLPSVAVGKKYHSENVKNYPKHVLMPGFINAYTDTSMTILRSLSRTVPESLVNLSSDEFISDSLKIGINEMLLNGTTCFSARYLLPEVAVELCKSLGIRALIGIDQHDDILDYVHKELPYEMKPDSLVNFAYTIDASSMLSDDSLQAMIMAYEQRPAPIQIIMSDVKKIKDYQQHFGMTPLARMQKHGVLQHHVIALDTVHLDEDDHKILAQSHCNIVANRGQSGGICNINKLQELGLNVAIGTGNFLGNNDLLADARSASLLNKGINRNPALSPASEVIEMLTINGAKALGLADVVGSLEIGKCADLVIWDTNTLNSYPKHDLAAQIVFAGNSVQISDVWVNGVQFICSRKSVRVDLTEICTISEKWQRYVV